MKTSTRTELLEHSRAKVELLEKYLSTYLNIISRVSYFEKINIYDLLCGEGKYTDNAEGSPIGIMKTIKNHHFSNQKKSPNIDVWFNDNGASEIEIGKKKIERVKTFVSEIYCPKNVTIKYSDLDYLNVISDVQKNVERYKKEKHLIFIDPHGYKDIKLARLKNLLLKRNTEIILFLPLFDMYRFANKSMKENFSGGTSLREFLMDVFNSKKTHFTSIFDFRDQLKNAFSIHTDCFVDTFLLQKEKNNYYALFFFTPNALGFEKMLEAKWKIDENEGRGFKLNSNQQSFFEEIEISSYPEDLLFYLKIRRSNSELYIFGLNNGYLPKHTIKVLKPYRNNSQIVVFDSLKNKMPKNGYYLTYKNYKSPPEKTFYYELNKK